MKRVAIIGGGPSGIAAAISASEIDCKVTIFEKQKKLLSKIYVTGNGTCNISNEDVSVSKYHSSGNLNFVKNILNNFSFNDCRNFFDKLDIPFVMKDRGRAYPYSLQASHVAEVLEYKLNELGVDVKLHRRVDSIFNNKKSFKLITAGKEEFHFDSVIIAAGGPAYPDLGGSKRGAILSEKLNHKVNNFIPVILPLNIVDKQLHRLQGIKQDVKLSVFLNNEKLCDATGEILFTKYGISGPVTLDISTVVNSLVSKGKSPIIEIDFFPNLEEKSLHDFLKNIFKDKKKKTIFSLESILKKKIPYYIFNRLNIDNDISNLDLDDAMITKFVKELKHLQIQPGEIREYKEAVTAAGGIDTSLIDPNTMESKRIKNLYFTGELIDVNGECGGFNLHFAWASGVIAGRSQVKTSS